MPGRMRRPTRTAGTFRRHVGVGVAVSGALSLPMILSACSDPPSPPAYSSGTVQTRTVPPSVSQVPLTDQHSRTVTLASFRGQTVMGGPFITLCSDIGPMTSGNLLQVERSLIAAGVAREVQIVELSVDPGRDSVARLAAYAPLTGATWELVT